MSGKRSLVPMFLVGGLLTAAPALAQVVVPEPPLLPTPQAECGPGSNPEIGMQGRVSQEEMDSGRAAEGYWCNAEMLGSHKVQLPVGNTIGNIAGFKVHRFVDSAGNECGFYDSTSKFPTGTTDTGLGVVVLDMSDPTNPTETARLTTPGVIQPHESLVLNEQRGILAAATGTLSTLNAILDIYDISDNCLQPTLLSTTPLPALGHESGITADGSIYWSAATAQPNVFAVDIRDPLVPVVVYHNDEFGSHGINVSDDGTRTYFTSSGTGIRILDTTALVEYVNETEPGLALPSNIELPLIAELDWDTRSIPQNTVPFTRDGRSYLMEVDEFGSCAEVGAARIIDITDETAPFVTSNLRLEVHQQENFDEICDDPGTITPVLQGYAAHYCHIPSRVDPAIVACSMINSGLRIFDITDPANPVETAYFNAPRQPREIFDQGTRFFEASNWAYSAPAFVPERKEVWYSDGFQGFFAVRLTNGAWPDPGQPSLPAAGGDPSPAPVPTDPAPAPDPDPAPAPTADPEPAPDATQEPAPTPQVGGSGTTPVTGASELLRLVGIGTLLTATDLARRRRRDG